MAFTVLSCPFLTAEYGDKVSLIALLLTLQT
jgi:hypothetical protein